MKITNMTFWYNSLYLYECEVRIDLSSGKVFFKTNFGDDIPEFNRIQKDGKIIPYECYFFIIDNYLDHLQECVAKTLDWDSYYGIDGISLGGYSWYLKLEMEDGEKKIIDGMCSKPESFDDFVCNLERLVGKQLSVKNRCV